MRRKEDTSYYQKDISPDPNPRDRTNLVDGDVLGLVQLDDAVGAVHADEFGGRAAVVLAGHHTHAIFLLRLRQRELRKGHRDFGPVQALQPFVAVRERLRSANRNARVAPLPLTQHALAPIR